LPATKFYSFTYDDTTDFNGYYDPLYGVVTADDDGNPHHFSVGVLGKNVFRTKKEAEDALWKQCTDAYEAALRRMDIVLEKRKNKLKGLLENEISGGSIV